MTVPSGATAFAHTKAPAGLPNHCSSPIAANGNKTKKANDVIYYENSCDLTDPLKGSQGPSGIHRAHFENHWP